MGFVEPRLTGSGWGERTPLPFLKLIPADPSGRLIRSNRRRVFSASRRRIDAALTELASRVKERLAADPVLDLDDVCFTAVASRSQMPVRLAIVARTREQTAEHLRLFAEGGDCPGVFRGTGKRKPLAFLFTGQGSQYLGMSAQLYRRFHEFRRTLDHCHELFRPHLDHPCLNRSSRRMATMAAK